MDAHENGHDGVFLLAGYSFAELTLEVAAAECQNKNDDRTSEHNHTHQSQLSDDFPVNAAKNAAYEIHVFLRYADGWL